MHQLEESAASHAVKTPASQTEACLWDRARPNRNVADAVAAAQDSTHESKTLHEFTDETETEISA